MFVTKTKKYAFGSLCFTLLALLLILAGCDASSDPRVYYQATGSWEGTLGAARVRGIIAPDGSYQLAVVDVNGDFIPEAGEYVGTVTITDRENNIGRMTVAYLRPSASAEILPTVTFKLSGSTLYSEDAPYNLSRTNDANGPAAQVDVAGRWSLSVSDTDAIPDITNLVVAVDGGLSGNDGGACQYSGTLMLIDPVWNIFQLSLNFSNYLGKDCQEDKLRTYKGLAMTLPLESNRRHLWLASTVWAFGGTKTDTYIKNLAATINVAPVAKMTANAIEWQPNDVQPIKVKQLSGTVKLDAQGSYDDNHDSLTYQWSVTDSNGAVQVFNTTTATFTPAMEGEFTIRLTANDGLLASAEIVQTIQVVWVVNRFVDCGNGTVLDTKNLEQPLFWLKDAGCSDLHGVAPDLWWVNLDTAKANVAALASPPPGSLAPGKCGLNDGSVASNWRLPLLAEFDTILEKNANYPGPPDLVNGVGDAQWSPPGDVFINVGNSPALYDFWIYWTSEPTFVYSYITYGYFVDFDGTQDLAPPPDPMQRILDAWSSYSPVGIGYEKAVWPVRDEISPVAGDEVNACLQASP